MKRAVPILAIIVALILVLSQSLYTVDQKQYAIKFQLGEFIDAQTQAGLYFKVPLVQNIRFFDRRILLLDATKPVLVPPLIRMRSPAAPAIACLRSPF